MGIIDNSSPRKTRIRPLLSSVPKSHAGSDPGSGSISGDFGDFGLGTSLPVPPTAVSRCAGSSRKGVGGEGMKDGGDGKVSRDGQGRGTHGMVGKGIRRGRGTTPLPGRRRRSFSSRSTGAGRGTKSRYNRTLSSAWAEAGSGTGNANGTGTEMEEEEETLLSLFFQPRRERVEGWMDSFWKRHAVLVVVPCLIVRSLSFFFLTKMRERKNKRNETNKTICDRFGYGSPSRSQFQTRSKMIPSQRYLPGQNGPKTGVAKMKAGGTLLLR